MWSLSSFCSSIVRDGQFARTDFVNAALPNTLCYAATAKYVHEANSNPQVSCVITTAELSSGISADKAVAIGERPQDTFFDIHNLLTTQFHMAPDMECGVDGNVAIHPTAIVEEGCRLERGVQVDAFAFVARNSWLEEEVRVGVGALIGVAGHFFKRPASGLVRVEHAGGVRIHRRAEILAGSIVQRAVYPAFTEIGEESVLGPRAHVAHGVKIGRRTTLTGNAQIAGYSIVGDDVWIGPGAIVGNLTTIGDGARVEIGSIVTQSIPEKGRYAGWYAMPHIRVLKAQSRLRLLP
jgi:UDP-3-O-[3-hydroxymyristoyl] glucosamine N-acyltransferase